MKGCTMDHEEYMRRQVSGRAPLGHILHDMLSGARIWVCVHAAHVSDFTRRYDSFEELMNAYRISSGRWRVRECRPGEQAEIALANRQQVAA